MSQPDPRLAAPGCGRRRGREALGLRGIRRLDLEVAAENEIARADTGRHKRRSAPRDALASEERRIIRPLGPVTGALLAGIGAEGDAGSGLVDEDGEAVRERRAGGEHVELGAAPVTQRNMLARS